MQSHDAEYRESGEGWATAPKPPAMSVPLSDTRPTDTCDDCPECRIDTNWTECCAACHCCPDELRCDDCRPAGVAPAEED